MDPKTLFDVSELKHTKTRAIYRTTYITIKRQRKWQYNETPTYLCTRGEPQSPMRERREPTLRNYDETSTRINTQPAGGESQSPMREKSDTTLKQYSKTVI